jgi:hypothetical protein
MQPHLLRTPTRTATGELNQSDEKSLKGENALPSGTLVMPLYPQIAPSLAQSNTFPGYRWTYAVSMIGPKLTDIVCPVRNHLEWL